MALIKRLLFLSALCILFPSCDVDDHALDMEILVSTVWLDVTETRTSGQVEYVYDFNSESVLTIYELKGIDYSEDKSCRYIFTPYEERMVIEDEGEYSVNEINVDLLILEKKSGKRTFVPYSGDADIPKKVIRK